MTLLLRADVSAGLVAAGMAAMFGCAVGFLVVSLIAAFLGFAGLPNPSVAAVAQVAFPAGIGLFAASALAAIIEIDRGGRRAAAEKSSASAKAG